MGKIGKFSFNDTCTLHVAASYGDKTCPMSDGDALDPGEVEIEVECTLYCDDPEDGVYAEDIVATISGLGVQLSEEAIDLLGLSARAGEVFMDTGVTHPERGTKYMDADDRIWTVVGSGMHYENAGDFTLLERRVRPRLIPSFPSDDGMRRMVVDTPALCIPITTEDGKQLFRHVIEEDEPPAGTLREAGAVYVGKPKSV